MSEFESLSGIFFHVGVCRYSAGEAVGIAGWYVETVELGPRGGYVAKRRVLCRGLLHQLTHRVAQDYPFAARVEKGLDRLLRGLL